MHDADSVLRSVAVKPEARGRGVGGRMVRRLLDSARRRGVRGIYLLTTTAEHYFPRHGFRPIPRDDAPPAVQRSVEFREACPASATAMALMLEGSD